MEAASGAAAPAAAAEAPTEAAVVAPGPPPPSPLSGGYLLIVIGEPYSEEHKQLILQRLAKGFLSWDSETCHVDLEKELKNLSTQAPEGEEARSGERLIQYASESLVTEVLIQPQTSTLLQCARNLLSSFTRHRHLIHAGYTFAGNGSWALQDGTFSVSDFLDALTEPEAQRVIRAYENSVSIDIHCSPEGDWSTGRLNKESCAKNCQIRVNPDDRLSAGSEDINAFVSYISSFITSAGVEQLLEPSDVVGNIRFSHPTLYVFPGGQGDAALFGINGFNMLVDGGYSRKSCFWDFTRHLDRLDAVMVTRINNSNINGIASVLKRKRLGHVYPQIGHFFCNVVERKNILSPDGDKDKDELLIDLLEEGHNLVTNLRHLDLKPHACYREPVVEPINLYHKVGHGKLDMYVISPSRDSKEVKDFLTKWNASDQKLFSSKTNKNELKFPLQNLLSICALLVWQPANPADTITRILFPGSTPQHKIFEGLEKLKHLEFLRHPVCTAKSLQPVIMKSKSKILEKISPETKPAVIKSSVLPQDTKSANLEIKSSKSSISNDKTFKQQATHGTTISSLVGNVKTEKATKTSRIESKIEKETEKIGTKSEKQKSETKTKTEHKSKSDSKVYSVKAKVESKSSTRTSAERKIHRTPSNEKKTEKSGPSTPKKMEVKVKTEIKSTIQSKPKVKTSPTATPAKSAKEANNRKVVESKIQASKVSTSRAPSKTRVLDTTTSSASKSNERKPISRRSKPASPSKGSRQPGSPSKSSSAKSTPTESIKQGNLENNLLVTNEKSDEVQQNESIASTPSTTEVTKICLENVNQNLVEKSEVTVLETEEDKILTQTAVEVENKAAIIDIENIVVVLKDSDSGVEREEEEIQEDSEKGKEEIDIREEDQDDIRYDEGSDIREEEGDDTKEEDGKETVSFVDSQIEDETEDDVYNERKQIETDDKISESEIEIEDRDADLEAVEDLISDEAEDKHVRDEEESEKERKSKDVEEKKVNDTTAPEVTETRSEKTSPDSLEHEPREEFVKPETLNYNEATTSDNKEVEEGAIEAQISPELKQNIEVQVKDIITSAQSVVATQVDSNIVLNEPEVKNESTESEEKMDISSEKNKDEISPEDDKKDQKMGEEGTNTKSQPEEKISAMETSATTAPSMPEDERIPLDEIKEGVEEKYIKEDTKESIMKNIEGSSNIPMTPNLPEVITSTPFDQNHHVLSQRDIVKTPDEVADLPVHEEADAAMYDNFESAKAEVKNDEANKEESEEAKDTRVNIDPNVQEISAENTNEANKENISEIKDVVKIFGSDEIAEQKINESKDEKYDNNLIVQKQDVLSIIEEPTHEKEVLRQEDIENKTPETASEHTEQPKSNNVMEQQRTTLCANENKPETDELDIQIQTPQDLDVSDGKIETAEIGIGMENPPNNEPQVLNVGLVVDSQLDTKKLESSLNAKEVAHITSELCVTTDPKDGDETNIEENKQKIDKTVIQTTETDLKHQEMDNECEDIIASEMKRETNDIKNTTSVVSERLEGNISLFESEELKEKTIPELANDANKPIVDEEIKDFASEGVTEDGIMNSGTSEINLNLRSSHDILENKAGRKMETESIKSSSEEDHKDFSKDVTIIDSEHTELVPSEIDKQNKNKEMKEDTELPSMIAVQQTDSQITETKSIEDGTEITKVEVDHLETEKINDTFDNESKILDTTQSTNLKQQKPTVSSFEKKDDAKICNEIELPNTSLIQTIEVEYKENISGENFRDIQNPEDVSLSEITNDEDNTAKQVDEKSPKNELDTKKETFECLEEKKVDEGTVLEQSGSAILNTNTDTPKAEPVEPLAEIISEESKSCIESITKTILQDQKEHKDIDDDVNTIDDTAEKLSSHKIIIPIKTSELVETEPLPLETEISTEIESISKDLIIGSENIVEECKDKPEKDNKIDNDFTLEIMEQEKHDTEVSQDKELLNSTILTLEPTKVETFDNIPNPDNDANTYEELKSCGKISPEKETSKEMESPESFMAQTNDSFENNETQEKDGQIDTIIEMEVSKISESPIEKINVDNSLSTPGNVSPQIPVESEETKAIDIHLKQTQNDDKNISDEQSVMDLTEIEKITFHDNFTVDSEKTVESSEKNIEIGIEANTLSLSPEVSHQEASASNRETFIDESLHSNILDNSLLESDATNGSCKTAVTSEENITNKDINAIPYNPIIDTYKDDSQEPVLSLKSDFSAIESMKLKDENAMESSSSGTNFCDHKSANELSIDIKEDFVHEELEKHISPEITDKIASMTNEQNSADFHSSSKDDANGPYQTNEKEINDEKEALGFKNYVSNGQIDLTASDDNHFRDSKILSECSTLTGGSQLDLVSETETKEISDPLTASYLEIIEKLQETEEDIDSNQNDDSNVEKVQKRSSSDLEAVQIQEESSINIELSPKDLDEQTEDLSIVNVKSTKVSDFVEPDFEDDSNEKGTITSVLDSVSSPSKSLHRVMLTASSEDGGDETELDTSVESKRQSTESTLNENNDLETKKIVEEDEQLEEKNLQKEVKYKVDEDDKFESVKEASSTTLDTEHPTDTSNNIAKTLSTSSTDAEALILENSGSSAQLSKKEEQGTLDESESINKVNAITKSLEHQDESHLTCIETSCTSTVLALEDNTNIEKTLDVKKDAGTSNISEIQQSDKDADIQNNSSSITEAKTDIIQTSISGDSIILEYKISSDAKAEIEQTKQLTLNENIESVEDSILDLGESNVKNNKSSCNVGDEILDLKNRDSKMISDIKEDIIPSEISVQEEEPLNIDSPITDQYESINVNNSSKVNVVTETCEKYESQISEICDPEEKGNLVYSTEIKLNTEKSSTENKFGECSSIGNVEVSINSIETSKSESLVLQLKDSDDLQNQNKQSIDSDGLQNQDTKAGSELNEDVASISDTCHDNSFENHEDIQEANIKKADEVASTFSKQEITSDSIVIDRKDSKTENIHSSPLDGSMEQMYTKDETIEHEFKESSSSIKSEKCLNAGSSNIDIELQECSLESAQTIQNVIQSPVKNLKITDISTSESKVSEEKISNSVEISSTTQSSFDDSEINAKSTFVTPRESSLVTDIDITTVSNAIVHKENIQSLLSSKEQEISTSLVHDSLKDETESRIATNDIECTSHTTAVESSVYELKTDERSEVFSEQQKVIKTECFTDMSSQKLVQNELYEIDHMSSNIPTNIGGGLSQTVENLVEKQSEKIEVSSFSSASSTLPVDNTVCEEISGKFNMQEEKNLKIEQSSLSKSKITEFVDESINIKSTTDQSSVNEHSHCSHEEKSLHCVESSLISKEIQSERISGNNESTFSVLQTDISQTGIITHDTDVTLVSGANASVVLDEQIKTSLSPENESCIVHESQVLDSEMQSNLPQQIELQNIVHPTPKSELQCSFEDTKLKENTAMTSSFYGSLPDDETVNESSTQVTKVSQGVRTEPSGIFSHQHEDDMYREEEEDAYHIFQGKPSNGNESQDAENGFESTGKSQTRDDSLHHFVTEVQPHASKSKEQSTSSDKKEFSSVSETQQSEGLSLVPQTSSGKSADAKDPIESWGKPLGLPAPAPPTTNLSPKGTPKKEKKIIANKKVTERSAKEVKLNKENNAKHKSVGSPMYFDLTYVPHHGNSHYTQVEFFKKIRARYYVFSGTEPSRDVYSALLEAKQTWDDKDLEVTIIPTYDTDTLGYWVAENEEALSQHKIDLSPSASRCTINLQDHETSCSAYRLEF